MNNGILHNRAVIEWVILRIEMRKDIKQDFRHYSVLDFAFLFFKSVIIFEEEWVDNGRRQIRPILLNLTLERRKWR